MTITVSVNVQNGAATHAAVITANHPAEEFVRFAFNPSALSRVTTLKALAAAFITELEAAERELPVQDTTDAFREARSHMRKASMLAVFGATTGA